MISARCITCVHLREGGEKAICDAFPDGIPEEIAVGHFDHAQPYEGDNGIRWEPTSEYKKFLEEREKLEG